MNTSLLPSSPWRTRLACLAASLLIASSLLAAPGDSQYAISTIKADSFPFYSQAPQFAEPITGAGTASGYQSSAFRFVSVASGPMEMLQVVLYNPGITGASARVVLYDDAGGKIGGRLREFPLRNLSVGVFTGYFAYNNYGSLAPNETATIITKGKAYWIGVEPLDDQSSVSWAASFSPMEAKRIRTTAAGSVLKDDVTPPPYVVLEVFEPFPPQVQQPGVPLVEGEQVPAEAQGVTLASVGVVPQTPCLGKIAVSRSKIPVILGADGQVKLRVGGSAPVLTGTKIAKLGEPSGDAVLVTLQHQVASGASPAVTAKDDVLFVGGIRTPPLRIIARTGEALAGAGGATIKSFTAIDGDGASTFFLAQLAGTTAKKDTVLAGAAGTGAAHVLVREGDSIGTPTVSIIATLTGFSGSLGEGRWRADDASIGARLTLSDKSNVLVTIPASAATQDDWTFWSATGVPLAAPLAGVKLKSIGAPGFGPDGVVFPATLLLSPNGPTAKNDAVLLHQTAAGFTVLAREGEEAPDDLGTALTGINFKAFGNPVYGPAGKVAFTATLSAKIGANGIWWFDGTNPLHLIARAGDPAPTLGTFSKFTNLVLPNTAGATPIFQATLVNQPAAQVSAATSAGIWALDTAGQIVLVVRNGDYIFLNSSLFGTMSGLSGLLTAAGSSGSAHGVDADGTVRIDATIANRAAPGKKRAQFTIPIPQP